MARISVDQISRIARTSAARRLSLGELRYIAEEVARQPGCGPLHVSNMAEAWVRAKLDRLDACPVTPDLIAAWGWLVDPEKNAAGLRSCHVSVGGRNCPPPLVAAEELKYLCEGIASVSMDPDLVYRQFQLIHPLRDGNGRVGKILLNYLANTLERPTMPSDWFGCANP